MRRVLIVFALLLWLPAAAAAAPVPADAYLDRLEEALTLVTEAERDRRAGDEDAARRKVGTAAGRLADVDQVQAEAGLTGADLTDLADALRAAEADPAALPAARRVLEEHLHAARELAAAAPVEAPGARAALNRALAAAARQSLLQQLRERFYALLFRQAERMDPGPLPPAAWWTAGAIGALALAWAAFVLYRNVTGHGAGQDGVRRASAGPAPARPPAPAELLQAAQDAAGRSDYLSALRLAHLGLLLRLDQVGAIRYRPSHTNREHEARLARQRPEWVPALRSLHDLVEGCLYGGRPAQAEVYRQAESLVLMLWREGDAPSGSGAATPGRSS